MSKGFRLVCGAVFFVALTALSGCLLAQNQKAANIDIGGGMVTVALASLLIGSVFLNKGKVTKKAIGAVLGACVFRLVYTVALRFNMPASMLKLVSSVIVIVAIFGPYAKAKYPMFKRKMDLKKQAITERRDENA